MPSADDPLIFRAPKASSALLSSALTGLLWLAASCGPEGDTTRTDSGPAPDLGVVGDAGTTNDAGAMDAGDAGAIDAGTMPDSGTAADGGATDDAAAALDGATDTDADLDAGTADDAGPRDAGPRDAYCDVDPLRTITATDAAPGLTLAEFTAMCDGLGGFIEVHPHCGGMNSCRGISYDSGTGVITEHTCAGLNTCTGYTCVLP